MKEVTEWNGKPRLMWVWDYDESYRVKDYIVCILSEEEMKETGTNCPVRALGNGYKHCAEIEEETKKKTYLTNYELSQLLKCFGVECSMIGKCSVQNFFTYEESKENDNALNTVIRYKGGEWMPTIRETVWKWWGEETPDSDIAKFVSFIGWDKE